MIQDRPQSRISRTNKPEKLCFSVSKKVYIPRWNKKMIIFCFPLEIIIFSSRKTRPSLSAVLKITITDLAFQEKHLIQFSGLFHSRNSCQSAEQKQEERWIYANKSVRSAWKNTFYDIFDTLLSCFVSLRLDK